MPDMAAPMKDLFEDHGPSGWDDTVNDCDGRCDRLGVPCRDCEAEQAEAFNEDPDEYAHEVAS